MVIYHLKKAKAWCTLAILSASLLAPMQTKAQRVAVKTNALYWATSTPNLGFEVGLAKKITLDVSGNYNPWKFGNDCQIKHWLVQPELRYWLHERFNGHFLVSMPCMPIMMWQARHF